MAVSREVDLGVINTQGEVELKTEDQKRDWEGRIRELENCGSMSETKGAAPLKGEQVSYSVDAAERSTNNSRFFQVQNPLMSQQSHLQIEVKGEVLLYNTKNVLALKPFPEKVASFIDFPTDTE